MKDLFNNDADRLQIINEEDFRSDILIKSLSLNDLQEKLGTIAGIDTTHTEDGFVEKYNMELAPTSDEEELANRLEIFKFLSENKRAVFHIADKNKLPRKDVCEINRDFYYKYLRDEPYLHEYGFISRLNNSLIDLPSSKSPRLEEFREQLSRVDDMVALEGEIANHVKDLTKNSGEYVGVVDVSIGASTHGYSENIYERTVICRDNEGVGITHISKLFSVKEFEINPLIRGFLRKKYVSKFEAKRNFKIKEEFYSDKLISNINYGLINSHISKVISNMLDENQGKTYEFIENDIHHESPLPLIAARCDVRDRQNASWNSGKNNLFDLRGKTINLSITYHIKAESISLTFNGFEYKQVDELKNFYHNHSQYLSGSVMESFINTKNKVLVNSKNYITGIELELMNLMKGTHVEYDTLLTGDIFNKYIPDIADYEPVNKALKIISEWKDYIFKNSVFFNGYVEIYKHFKPSLAAGTLALPNLIKDGKKTLSFRNLLPVHLLDEMNSSTKKKHTLNSIKAITALDSYGSNLIVLTGQNAGGKSVALETIINTTWLAHCGLPVFGDSFSFNIREFLGICFLSRGQGSTMQLQSQKIANMLGAFKGSENPDRCLSIIDELGTGTTQDSIYDPSGGFGFGAKVLNAHSDYDTIISTQITPLAEHAEENLDGAMYMFDDKHNISEGIGRPDLTKLIKQTGLDAFIN